jgi:hypothetical protein
LAGLLDELLASFGKFTAENVHDSLIKDKEGQVRKEGE